MTDTPSTRSRSATKSAYFPSDPQAANLMFMLVSRRYERASLIVTSNKPFAPGQNAGAVQTPRGPLFNRREPQGVNSQPANNLCSFAGWTPNAIGGA